MSPAPFRVRGLGGGLLFGLLIGLQGGHRGRYHVGGLLGTRRKEPSLAACDEAQAERLWHDSMAIATRTLGEATPIDDSFRRGPEQDGR